MDQRPEIQAAADTNPVRPVTASTASLKLGNQRYILFCDEDFGAALERAFRIWCARRRVRDFLVVRSIRCRPAGTSLRQRLDRIFRLAMLAAKNWYTRRERNLVHAEDVNNDAFRRTYLSHSGEIYGIIAGFDQIFHQRSIQRFTGFYAFHPSLLPYYRGPTPSHWCIVNGERYSGITLHEVTRETNRGRILWQREKRITTTNPLELDRVLALEGARFLPDLLDHLDDRKELPVTKVAPEQFYRNLVDYRSFPEGLKRPRKAEPYESRRIASFLGVVNATPRNLLAQHQFVTRLKSAARRCLTGRVIDIGCETKEYARILSPYVEEHVGLGHAGCERDRLRVDLVATAYQIPAESESFDSAICTALLEHLAEPERALRECHRVLKVGGTAVYGMPFLWNTREGEREFFRFSKSGIEYLFEKTGFEIIELERISGSWGILAQLLIENLYRLHRGVVRRVPIIPAIALVIQAASYLLDGLERNGPWNWAYMVIALKRAPGSPERKGRLGPESREIAEAPRVTPGCDLGPSTVRRSSGR